MLPTNSDTKNRNAVRVQREIFPRNHHQPLPLYTALQRKSSASSCSRRCTPHLSLVPGLPSRPRRFSSADWISHSTALDKDDPLRRATWLRADDDGSGQWGRSRQHESMAVVATMLQGTSSFSMPWSLVYSILILVFSIVLQAPSFRHS